jgi:hypothetical protein
VDEKKMSRKEAAEQLDMNRKTFHWNNHKYLSEWKGKGGPPMLSNHRGRTSISDRNFLALQRGPRRALHFPLSLHVSFLISQQAKRVGFFAASSTNHVPRDLAHLLRC